MTAPRRTKRIPTVRTAAIPAGGVVDLRLERGVCAFSIAVVDAALFAAGPVVDTPTEVADAQTGAAAAITATLPGVAAETTYLAGFTVDGLGATAGSVVEVTVTGLLGGTKRYKLTIPAGVAVALANPLRVDFDRPLAASALNTAIVVNVPSFGAGNTSASVSAHGYQLAATVAGAAVPWTLAYESDPASVRHFAAGERYVEDFLRLGPLTLHLGAAVAARVELIAWRS